MLNIFNRLINITKEKNISQNFIEELGEVIDKKISKNNIPRKEKSLIQELLSQNKLTTEYRDKMHIERSRILNEYAERTADEGRMYYIYNKDNDEKDMYHLCVCNKEDGHKVIKVKEGDLPQGAGVESVLRIENGKYVVDNIATEKIYEEMQLMVQQLLKEQTQKMEERRVEGHSYEVIEALSKKVYLIDITIDKNNGECFEELLHTGATLEYARAGEIFKYSDGKYISCKEKYNE